MGGRRHGRDWGGRFPSICEGALLSLRPRISAGHRGCSLTWWGWHVAAESGRVVVEVPMAHPDGSGTPAVVTGSPVSPGGGSGKETEG